MCSILSIVYVLGMIASESRKSTEYALLPSIGIISERDSLDLINSQVLHAIWDSRRLLDFNDANDKDGALSWARKLVMMFLPSLESVTLLVT